MHYLGLIIGGILAIAALLGAITVLWKFMRYIFRVDKAAPILLVIAEQFKPNGGSTMFDKINNIGESVVKLTETLERRFQEQQIETRLAVKLAEDSRLIAQTNSKIVNELGLVQSDDIKHLRDYLHDKVHELNNTLTITNMQSNLADKRSARIEQRLDKMFPLIERHREDFEHGDQTRLPDD